jgi:alpha-L-arabinofuranosidase
VTNNDYLEFCLKFFNKIYAIQRRGLYSHLEISHLIKEIEVVKDEIKEKNTITILLDSYYKGRTSWNVWDSEIFTNEYCLTSLRYLFHQHLKNANQDPLKTLV